MSNKNHILLVCGALFGNGEEIDELQSFCLELKRQNRLILIRNDTDENILQILNIIADKNSEFNKDLSSSTDIWNTQEEVWRQTLNRNCELDIICNIMNCSLNEFWNDREDICKKLLKLPLITELVEQAYYYYDMGDFVFVHGWVPVDEIPNKRSGSIKYKVSANWRSLPKEKWYEALCAYEDELGLIDDIEITVPVPNRTVVCSHMYNILRKLSFNSTKDSAPYYDEGRINIGGSIKCIVFNQDKDNNVKIVNGKTNLGVFWMCCEDIIFDFETIDLDKSRFWNDKATLNYSKDIKDIWKEQSIAQYNGKYQNYDFNYFPHGQVHFDTKSHWSIIELQKFSQGNFYEVYRIDYPREIHYTFNDEETEFDEDKIRQIFKLAGATVKIEK